MSEMGQHFFNNVSRCTIARTLACSTWSIISIKAENREKISASNRQGRKPTLYSRDLESLRAELHQKPTSMYQGYHHVASVTLQKAIAGKQFVAPVIPRYFSVYRGFRASRLFANMFIKNKNKIINFFFSIYMDGVQYCICCSM